MEIEDFDTSSARITPDHYVGPKKERSGGRIDILIRNGFGRCIPIENKIDAEDQENQVTRYQAADPRSPVIYLTPNGREPSKFSCDDDARARGVKVKCTSYKEDILGWLRDCRKEVAACPGVREAITQYIHLVEDITYQSCLGRMNKQLIETILEDEKSYHAFLTLHREWDAARCAIIERFYAHLDSVICPQRKVKRWLGETIPLWEKDGDFYFETENLAQHNLLVGFTFERSGFRGFSFGFARREFNSSLPDESIGNPLREKFKAAFRDCQINQAWPAWTWWNDYLNWDDKEFEEILSKRFADVLKRKLEDLLIIANDVLR